MALSLLLAAVLATDLAVAALFLTLRGRRGQTANSELPPEVADLVFQLRADLEQASAELGRQKTQLRRMLGEIERKNAPLRSGSGAVLNADVVSLAEQGLSLRAIAGRTGTSLEEVRLTLAMQESQATA
jgi:hypothetical protein